MKKLIYVCIGLLILYNIYVTYSLIKVKDTFKEFHLLYSSVQENARTQSEYIKEVNEIRIQEMYVNNTKINSDIVLLDKTGKRMSIIDIFDRKKLIFRFADSYCAPCINKYLSRLKKSQTNTDCNDIILLVASDDKQAFFKNFNTDGFEVFFVDNMNFIEYDNNENPYFFSVSKDLVIRDCYIPDESQLDLLETILIRQLSLLSMN
jgi:hypothetical protein